MAIEEDIQSFSPGDFIELFTLDASFVNGPVYNFTSSAYADGPIVFDGVSYTPIPVEAEGFEWNGQGRLPTPKIRISNVNRTLLAAVQTYSDLVGSTVTRVRTFKQYLDDGDTPDPDSVFPIDVYKIERKTNHNKIFIEFELSAAIDQEGRKLPGRQVLKDACTHIYRRYTDGAFVYDGVTCPYVDENYLFTEGDLQTFDPSADKCGKRLTSCRLRFGENGKLPTRAFPGIGDGF